MNNRRVGEVAVIVLLSVLLMTTPASAQRPSQERDGGEPGAALINRAQGLLDQQDLPEIQAAVSGLSAPRRGVVIAQLIPPAHEIADLEVGETYEAPILGAAPVDARGRFSLGLDPNRLPLAVGANDVYLLHLSNDGAAIGAKGVQLEMSLQRGVKDIQTLSGVALDRSTTPSRWSATDDTFEDEDQTYSARRRSLSMQDGDYEEYQHPMCFWTKVRDFKVDATIAVTGSRSKWVDYKIVSESSSSSTVGMAVNFYGTFESSGTTTVTNSNKANFNYQSEQYGRHAFRADEWMREEEGDCYLMPDHTRVRSIGLAGTDLKVVRVGYTDTPYCEKLNNSNISGATVISSTKATTWSGGLKSSSVIGINLSRQQGYSNRTEVYLKPTRSNRWACGRYGYPTKPGEGSPGYILGDYTCRSTNHCVDT